MHLRNRTDEVIASIKRSKLTALKRFLKTLKVSSESAEMVDCILNHPKCRWTGPHTMELFEIDTDDDEHLVIVFGKTQIHAIIKKNKESQKLLNHLLKYIPFPKFEPKEAQKSTNALLRKLRMLSEKQLHELASLMGIGFSDQSEDKEELILIISTEPPSKIDAGLKKLKHV